MRHVFRQQQNPPIMKTHLTLALFILWPTLLAPVAPALVQCPPHVSFIRTSTVHSAPSSFCWPSASSSQSSLLHAPPSPGYRTASPSFKPLLLRYHSSPCPCFVCHFCFSFISVWETWPWNRRSMAEWRSMKMVTQSIYDSIVSLISFFFVIFRKQMLKSQRKKQPWANVFWKFENQWSAVSLHHSNHPLFYDFLNKLSMLFTLTCIKNLSPQILSF